ncbi:hypothetical protein KC19_9G043300 [Ceratodon purpureus]|uniref:Purple acid phosphatase n=1 Tax=Ceratodon purpureus TaxID=3225 RepID=A0A8T0GQ88_CERPU|nr:hypothetical protein KC19_9G043300 [Ceratodon purpureus]
MAILGTKPVSDEEVGLLASEHSEEVEDQGTSTLRPATLVAAVVTIFLMSGCLISLYTYSQSDHDSSEEYSLESLTKPKYPLNFLVVGDWGREGAYNQTLVAKQMGKVGRHLGIKFVISVGDNFYQAGLKGPQDPKFKNSFSKVYTAESLQTQWLAVLGNHDYLGDALLQIGDGLTRKDKRWFCDRFYQLKYPLCGSHNLGHCEKFVELFFIDTTPFVDKYWDAEQARTFDWRGIGPRQEYLDSQLKNLSLALESSTATWKIVVGHHTIRSLGRHGETPELVKSVLPILESHNVDVYINGHDHCLEHIKREDSAVHFVTSGAGSKSFQGLREGTTEEGLQFGYDGQGFISVSMAAQVLRIDFHDALGNNLYELNLKK